VEKSRKFPQMVQLMNTTKEVMPCVSEIMIKMPVCGKYTNVYYLTFVMVWNIKEIPTNGT
jgi:hypothetical protein